MVVCRGRIKQLYMPNYVNDDLCALEILERDTGTSARPLLSMYIITNLFSSFEFQGIPPQIIEHISDTCSAIITVCHEAGRSSLHHFYFQLSMFSFV